MGTFHAQKQKANVKVPCMDKMLFGLLLMISYSNERASEVQVTQKRCIENRDRSNTRERKRLTELLEMQ